MISRCNKLVVPTCEHPICLSLTPLHQRLLASIRFEGRRNARTAIALAHTSREAKRCRPHRRAQPAATTTTTTPRGRKRRRAQPPPTRTSSPSDTIRNRRRRNGSSVRRTSTSADDATTRSSGGSSTENTSPGPSRVCATGAGGGTCWPRTTPSAPSARSTRRRRGN
jgi:hypothetical protein